MAVLRYTGTLSVEFKSTDEDEALARTKEAVEVLKANGFDAEFTHLLEWSDTDPVPALVI